MFPLFGYNSSEYFLNNSNDNYDYFDNENNQKIYSQNQNGNAFNYFPQNNQQHPNISKQISRRQSLFQNQNFEQMEIMSKRNTNYSNNFPLYKANPQQYQQQDQAQNFYIQISNKKNSNSSNSLDQLQRCLNATSKDKTLKNINIFIIGDSNNNNQNNNNLKINFNNNNSNIPSSNSFNNGESLQQQQNFRFQQKNNQNLDVNPFLFDKNPLRNQSINNNSTKSTLYSSMNSIRESTNDVTMFDVQGSINTLVNDMEIQFEKMNLNDDNYYNNNY